MLELTTRLQAANDAVERTTIDLDDIRCIMKDQGTERESWVSKKYAERLNAWLFAKDELSKAQAEADRFVINHQWPTMADSMHQAIGV